MEVADKAGMSAVFSVDGGIWWNVTGGISATGPFAKGMTKGEEKREKSRRKEKVQETLIQVTVSAKTGSKLIQDDTDRLGLSSSPMSLGCMHI